MKYLIYIIFALVIMQNSGFAQSKKDYIRKGNEYYKKSFYDSAHSSYENSYLKDTNYAKPLYNNGLTLYRLNKFDEAIKNFNSFIVKEKDKELISKAYYNLGNSYFMKGYNALQDYISQSNQITPEVYQNIIRDLRNSLEAYKNSLRYNPYDNDAKHNYSFLANILNQLKDNQKQNQNSGSKGQQNHNDQQSKNQNQNQQGNEQNKKQNNSQEQQSEKNNQSWTDKLNSNQQQQRNESREQSNQDNKKDKSLADKLPDDQKHNKQGEQSKNQNISDNKQNSEQNKESLIDKLFQSQNDKQQQQNEYTNVRNKVNQEEKLNQQNQLKNPNINQQEKLRVINLLNNDEKKIQNKLKKKQGIIIRGKKDW